MDTISLHKMVDYILSLPVPWLWVFGVMTVIVMIKISLEDSEDN